MSIKTPESISQTSHYRPDIDGLRALAILLVVGFHAFPEAIPGGFVGVDIFFVISGYLITGIILSEIKREKFSFRHFYIRRIKRIFPALIAVFISSYLFAWFTLLPEELKELGKHIAGGAGFAANFVLWGEAGYFDNQAELKPFLHLWSLGVEEQFYFIWPILLILFFTKRLRLLYLLAGLSALSFLLNIKWADTDPTADFFWPFTRFWELLAGASLVYFHSTGQRSTTNRVIHNIAALFGCSLITLAAILLDKNSVFPGWWTLLPVIGAFLIIFSGTSAWLNRTILAHPAMVFIGLISYPLYLWHWPLFSFNRILSLERTRWETQTGLIAASFFPGVADLSLYRIPDSL